jgi:hypothetical protein
MQDESSHDPARAYDEMERDVLYLLTDLEDCQPLWSAQDIGRAIETKDPMALVNGLLRAGLVYRTSDGFIFATRAAVRMVQMVDRAI